MRIACLLALLALTQSGERWKTLAGGVRIAAAQPATDPGKRVTALLSDPARWAAGFRTVEDKLGGKFADGTTVEVVWDYDGAEFAKMAGRTTIRFNLKKLELYQAKLEELERRREELAKDGKRMVYRLPPAKLERFIPHELTHVLQKQRGVEAPEWFEEGLAQWVGDDPNVLIGYALAGKQVGLVGELLPDPDDVYARGHLFFKWLDSRGGLRKAVQASFFGGVSWKKAIEDATGLGWEALRAEEAPWSARELDKLRPPEK
jgi:hypothetical protein